MGNAAGDQERVFDVVLLCEVIEHLQTDPMRVLLEVKRVLKFCFFKLLV